MSLIAEFEIDSGEFFLGEAVSQFPDLRVEVERVVPVGTQVMPYLWAYGDDLDAFESTLRDDDHVDSLVVLDRLPSAALYKITWETGTKRLVTEIVDLQGTVLDAHGSETWTFRLRFETQDGLPAFRELCRSLDVDHELVRVGPLTEEPDRDRSGELTRPQYETLKAALERGYFKVPREVTFAELAEDLGISEQAVSERVRRGTDTVLRAGLETIRSFDQSADSNSES